MAADNQVLEPAESKAKDVEHGGYLAHLIKRIRAGGHGVNLGKMTREEIRARLLGD